jgi:hypothetical protein
MGFLRSKIEAFEFEGRKVEAKIQPIEYGDFLSAEKAFSNGASEDLATLMTSVVRKYAELVVAPIAADGTPVTLDEVCRFPYFLTLARSIFTSVIDTGRAPDPKASGES